MRSVVERLDKKACLFAVFLGVVCSVGLFCSLTAEITGDNSPGILWKNDVMVFCADALLLSSPLTVCGRG